MAAKIWRLTKGAEKKAEAFYSLAEYQVAKQVMEKISKIKTEANVFLIKPAMGKSFAEVLSDMKVKAKPEEAVTEVKCIRHTKA